MGKFYAIHSDLSGVAKLTMPEGGFDTRQEALERLVDLLAGERLSVQAKLTSARRALRAERRK